MRHILHIIACLLFAGGLQAQDATEIVDKAAALYADSNGLTARFAIRTHSEQQNATESFEGTIHMKGDKFTMQTPDLLTWYDGTTQWTYMIRSEEVNITTPEGDDLQLTNPSILLSTYKKGFTAAYKGESTATNGKAAYDIELTPKKKGNILKVILQIEKYAGWPAAIRVEMKNGIGSTITISDVKTGINQPDRFFTFNPADYPDAEIIDLR